jgi:hemoglobin/transferrin/lactoferrin receptor protein
MRPATRVLFLTTALAAAPLCAALGQSLSLDVITVTAGKTNESAIDALAGVSYLSSEELQKLAATLPSEIFRTLPGVYAAPLGNDPGAIVNIRGLQNFGRVAVTIDGARQDFSRNSHAGNGSFYLEPELLKSLTVVRGPVGNTWIGRHWWCRGVRDDRCRRCLAGGRELGARVEDRLRIQWPGLF